MADTLDQALAAAEQDVADEVRAVLDDLADEIAAQLANATEIVAARFSLGRIGRLWSERVPRIMRRLFRVAETAGERAAGDVDAELPGTWDDLPGRYNDGNLPASLGDYAEQTEHLLRAVGDRLTAAAVAALAEGLDAGEDTAQLRNRLRDLFAADGAQLGESREDLIARTESTRAWNGATLAAAQDLSGPDRPLVKQWQTRRDSLVRDAHDDVDGQIQLLDDAFTVAGVAMAYPGDPTAPPALVCNCRCVLRLQRAERSAAAQSQVLPPTGFSDQRHETAADGSHLMGGMIALIPTREDAERLALDGGEDADELHCTLMFLGDQGGDWTDDQRNELIAGIRARFAALPGPIEARLFGVNHWNPGDDGVWVWATGDDTPAYPALPDARALAVEALEDTHDRPEVPEQHSPWVAHVTGAYDADTWPLAPMCERLGPVTFDRVRVAFGGEHTDIPLGPEEEAMPDTTAAADYTPPVRTWTTPGDTALAYENQQSGDGRVLAAGSLYWDSAGPWPLQYADEMGMGHDGAELAGAIQQVDRDGDRIPGSGVLYMTQDAGWEAITLLEQEAPLGVSVDLDDVSIELVDNTPQDEAPDGEDAPVVASATYARASVLRLGDDSWVITASSAIEATASGSALARTSQTVQIISDQNGRIPADAARALFPAAALTAAAGDADDPESGVVVHAEDAGSYIVRVTRARFRGATLVAMPAFDKARIVLDPEPPVDEGEPTEAPAEDIAAAAAGDLDRVVAHVCGSPVPVGAREVADALGMTVSTAKRHLRAAVRAERVVRLSRGLYAAPVTIPEGEVSAAASGDLDLPVHDERDAEWDGDAAGSRVLAWATDDAGNVDADKLGQAFLYRDADADPATLAAYKLGFADVFTDGSASRLEIVANGVYAVAGALSGARGGVDIPADEQDAIRGRVEQLYAKLAEAYDDDSIRAPWADDSSDDDAMSELEASAWRVMQEQPPMPAEWFREPTPEELPPGSGGVHYANGRVYGWVAQAGVPHAVHGRKVQIEKLGRLDFSHFLRAKFRLDDGSEVAAGTITMNVGHHRDGWQCETAACQFDDSGTVGGIVTVGQNEGGLWFSGAAAPWLSEWDLNVFRACQPSYHMTQGSDGAWQLKAVLTVPVPAHSSPLEPSYSAVVASHIAATAVVERANLALTAAAAALDLEAQAAPVVAPEVEPEPEHARPDEQPPPDVDAFAAALLSPTFLDTFAAALEERQQQRAEVRAEVEALAALVDEQAAVTVSAAPQQEGI
jgi:2'-5' RNA ligase